jgi:hypothetical protein
MAKYTSARIQQVKGIIKDRHNTMTHIWSNAVIPNSRKNINHKVAEVEKGRNFSYSWRRG